MKGKIGGEKNVRTAGILMGDLIRYLPNKSEDTLY
jgi:hypothetical protein